MATSRVDVADRSDKLVGRKLEVTTERMAKQSKHVAWHRLVVAIYLSCKFAQHEGFAPHDAISIHWIFDERDKYTCCCP